MSPVYNRIRTKVSAIAAFLLLFQFSQAQDTSKITKWVNDNLPDLGGRAVMMVYKDGKMVYAQAFNNLSKKQENRQKIKAKLTGADEEQLLQDYTLTTRERIASC
ncbi:MAG TPA: hypothetical protein VFV46_00020, partial [Lacibacter sp.]|nr:hypothetical protein [Lacibacter sp.]